MRREFTLAPAGEPKPWQLGAVVAVLTAVTFVAAYATGCGDSGHAERDIGVDSGEVAVTSSPTPPTTLAEAVTRAAISGPVAFADAEAAYRDKRYGEATALFTAYSERRPENPWGHYMLGLSAWKAGHADRAVPAFERVLERDSTHVKALLNLSRVLLEIGRSEDAIQRIERVVGSDSTLGEAWRVLGRARAELDQVDGAIEAYQRALALDDGDAWSMNNLGLLHVREGRFEEALPPLARVVELRPDVAAFQNNLGIALERAGQYGAAGTAYRAALAADSAHAKASVSLARVEGKLDSVGVVPVDLAALARGFVAETARWREEFGVGAAETPSKPEPAR
ncbi:MAG: tetratricopeptide repeat protein [Gemmatimonadales bacterium]